MGKDLFDLDGVDGADSGSTAARRPPFRLIAVVLVVLVLAGGYGLARRGGLVGGTVFSVQLGGAKGIEPGALVKRRGIDVGEVISRSLEGGEVVVQVRMHPEFDGELRQDDCVWVGTGEVEGVSRKELVFSGCGQDSPPLGLHDTIVAKGKVRCAAAELMCRGEPLIDRARERLEE